MIGITISGGLGNQMFQYAFILNQSLKNRRPFYLDKSGGPIDLYKYFRLKVTPFYVIDILFFNYNGFKLIFSHYLRGRFYLIIRRLFIKNYVSSPKGTASPSTLNDKFNDNTFYNGYYQSPLYFSENETQIRKYFELKNSLKKAYNSKFGLLTHKNTIVTIHIRKTDFLSLKSYNLGDSDLSLPYSYYHHIIKKIHTDKNFYVFISDSPELIPQEFGYVTNKYISRDNEITDFQHMLNADICIIANSTFSWWAAYLNKKEKKKIYCPKYFLGHKIKKEYPVGIYPDSWIKIETE